MQTALRISPAAFIHDHPALASIALASVLVCHFMMKLLYRPGVSQVASKLSPLGLGVTLVIDVPETNETECRIGYDVRMKKSENEQTRRGLTWD